MTQKRISILCEDKQHAAFIRRFLRKRKWRIHTLSLPVSGEGSAEKFVRDKYPKYLDAVRKRNGKLAVVIDGNTVGALERMRQLDTACVRENIDPRNPTDPAAVFIPTRNIETWLAYLDGKSVDETQSYPPLEEEGECKRHVTALIKMCSANKLRPPAPPSLQAACEEYAKLR